jgi:hypothetical protein
MMKQESGAPDTNNLAVGGGGVAGAVGDLDLGSVNTDLETALAMTGDPSVVVMRLSTSTEGPGRWLVLSDDGEAFLLIEDGANLDVYIPDWIDILPGELLDGEHVLDGLEGTTVTTAEEVRTNADGEYNVSFHIPFDVFADSSTSCASFISALRFNGETVGQAEGGIAFTIQQLAFDDVDIDPEDVVRNGDTLDFNIDLKDGNGDVENVTLLPDFSELDSAAAVPDLTDEQGLLDFIADIQDAINAGRLEIRDDGGGGYEISYTISDTNDKPSGLKCKSICDCLSGFASYRGYRRYI